MLYPQEIVVENLLEPLTFRFGQERHVTSSPIIATSATVPIALPNRDELAWRLEEVEAVGRGRGRASIAGAEPRQAEEILGEP